MNGNQVINVIHLPHREDRLITLYEQKEEQGFNLRLWQGIVVPQIPFVGICRAHKQIVADARLRGLPSVTIAEDDIVFTAKGAWEYYLHEEPPDYDIYFGMVYQSEIQNNKVVFGLSGLTLYTVHERFYDSFLALNEMNNFDREIGRFAYKYKYMVCDKFVCYQSDGYSDNKKVNAVYGYLLDGRTLFDG